MAGWPAHLKRCASKGMMPPRHTGASPGCSPQNPKLLHPHGRMAKGSAMNRSAAASEALAASSGPWLTRPFRGLIGRFGVAFFLPVLEATLLITMLALALPAALLQVYDRILPNKATGTLVV